MEEGFKNKSEKTKYRSSARKKCSFRSHFFFLCSVEFTIQNRFGNYFFFKFKKNLESYKSIFFSHNLEDKVFHRNP